MNTKIGRNSPCPCGSGKKYKKCCMQNPITQQINGGVLNENDGVRAVVKGAPPTAKEQEIMSKEYQNKIRESPLWEVMVKEYGEEKANEMLKDFKVQVE